MRADAICRTFSAEKGINEKEEITKQKRKQSKILTVLFWILLAVLAAVMILSGYKVFTILNGYREGKDTYQKIEEEVLKPAGPDDSVFFPDFERLKAINPDCVGYLHCEDVLSYPVVQGKDNDYYLTHMFDGTENSVGAVFMDAGSPGPDADNCILYGHNMNDGSMFGVLNRYAEESFCAAHPVFDLFTETEHHRYRVLSAYRTPVDGVVYQTGFSTKKDFQAFKEELAANCPYDTGCDIKDDPEPLLTLSTCTPDASETERFVVVLQRETEE